MPTKAQWEKNKVAMKISYFTPSHNSDIKTWETFNFQFRF